jgi:diguanylate cyclase (GGDEF)-like protein
MACVRACPAGAVAVEGTSVWIVEDACRHAGICVEVCPHDAVDVIGDTDRTLALLRAGRVTLLLSAEAAVHFHPHAMEQVVNACYRLGFTAVHHGVIGEELVAAEYLRLWDEPHWRTLIRSTCPVVVERIRHEYPELVPYLAPVTTPFRAEVDWIRQTQGADMPIVYVGVCLADVDPVVEAAITFHELGRLLDKAGIALSAQPGWYTRIPGERRRHVSTAGGMPLPVLMEERQASHRFRKFRGLGALDAIRHAVMSGIDLGFVDLLPCDGCLDHPLLGPREELFWRRRVAAQSEPPRCATPVVEPGTTVDVTATFTEHANGGSPREDEIQAVLTQIGTAPTGAPWDCGACGFKTCRAFAAALTRGRAALRQCPPHQERLAVEAQREAAVDALTGLATYKVLRDRLTNEVARTSRSGDPFAVLFLDLDGFKQVNDTYGHRAGSEVLAAVGQVLLKAVRTTDVAGRYGGDEFVVLLVRTDVAGALRVAEVIRDRIGAVGRALGYDPGFIAASIGVAECDPRHATGGDVLERADRALYRAKAAGGNRIEV